MHPDAPSASLPPIGFAPSARRLGVWSAAAVASVAVLLLPAMVPGWQWLPGDAAPAAAVLVFLTALACEFLDSSLGMGYGTTLTPLLLLVGYEPLQIVPAVLFSEALTGLAAGALHHRDGNVDLLNDRRAQRTALLLGALSAFGATAAVLLAVSLSRAVLGTAVSIVILAMGVVILATLRRPIPYRPSTLVAVGALAAFNKGLSGGGYGPLTTAGQVVSGLSAKHAVAITSVAEALTCVVGLAGYWLLGQSLDWGLTLPLTLGAVLSVPLATHTVRRLPETAVRGSVGVLTLVLGALALARVLAG